MGSNRTSEVWGERTPIGAGAEWPVRVDEHVVEHPDRWVQSACVLCSNGRGMDIGVKDGRIVGVRGRAEDRVNCGRVLGRRPESGLLLLRSPRQLYLQAQEVSFHWIVAGQLAQATRDPELLALVDDLHRETLTQIKWLKTQVKQSSPQALVVGAGS